MSAGRSPASPLKVLVFSTLYPSSARPTHGLFVETRLRKLLESGRITAKVVAPVPWFFSTDERFGRYAVMARTPRRETRSGIDILYPRFFLPPKVGMSAAPFLLALGAAAALRRLRREGFDFDLIDAHYYYPDGVAAALLAAHCGRPFVVTARGSDINLLATRAVPRALIRWAARRAAASIAVSGALDEKLASLGVEGPRRVVLRNGVDLERFRPVPREEARARLGWPPGPALLLVGTLDENKGHHLVIGALPRLPGFRLVIVGSGPARARLEAMAVELGVADRVRFAGAVLQTGLPDYYSAADVLVLASGREGWPNVLLESMACGTPVVATDVGGVAEIVADSRAGVVIQDRSSAGVVAGIERLLSAPPGRDATRGYAEMFSWDATTAGQLDLFSRLAAAHCAT